mgnify:CR=1 FL=1
MVAAVSPAEEEEEEDEDEEEDDEDEEEEDDEEDEDEDGLDCYIMPLGEEAKDLAMQIIAMLRANGFTCEMDHVSRGLKGQFKSADRFNAHFSIILGEEEVKNEVVNIKCNHDKEQVVVTLENILAHIENHLSGGHEHE